MTREEEKTCEERIAGQYAGRLEDIKDAFEMYRNPPECNDCGDGCKTCEEYEDKNDCDDYPRRNSEWSEESFNEYGLSFTYEPTDHKKGINGHFNWLLGWGGPGDELQFYTDPEFQLNCVVYRFFDWGGSAELAVNRSHKDFDFWHELWDFYNECGSPSYWMDESLKNR